MMNTLALLLIVQYMYGCTFWDDNLFNQMAVVGPMCCCMLLLVLIKLYTFVHNKSFCNTFGANVYSHPVPVKIIKLLWKLKNVGCVQLCAVFGGCVHWCVVFSIFIAHRTTARDMRSRPKYIELTGRPWTSSAEIVYHSPLNYCRRSSIF